METEPLARLLADLRRDGRRQSGLDPALVPPDAAAAYRVAADVAGQLGWPVAGWKIAANKPEMQQALRASAPMAGRVFQPFLRRDPATFDHATLLWPLVECELVVRLGADLPGRPAGYTPEEVAAAVAAIHVGVEVAECRFVHDDAFPPLTAILADSSGSGHLVVGPEIPDWRDADIPGAAVSLTVNGVERRTGRVADAIGHPLETVGWLANQPAITGGLRAGQVVSTGTCSGMLLAQAGDEMRASFGGLGAVSLDFRA